MYTISKFISIFRYHREKSFSLFLDQTFTTEINLIKFFLIFGPHFASFTTEMNTIFRFPIYITWIFADHRNMNRPISTPNCCNKDIYSVAHLIIGCQRMYQPWCFSLMHRNYCRFDLFFV